MSILEKLVAVFFSSEDIVLFNFEYIDQREDGAYTELSGVM